MNRGNDTASKPRGIKEGRKKGTGEKGKEHSRRQILPNSGWRAWAQPWLVGNAQTWITRGLKRSESLNSKQSEQRIQSVNFIAWRRFGAPPPRETEVLTASPTKTQSRLLECSGFRWPDHISQKTSEWSTQIQSRPIRIERFKLNFDRCGGTTRCRPTQGV